MLRIKIIAGLIIGWFALASIISYLILPNQLIETEIQRTKKIKRLAGQLKSKSKSKTLKNIYNYVTKKYVGNKQKYKLAIIPRLFYYDVDKLLNKKNYFLACHIQNKIIITLLINSGKFKRKDIQRIHYITSYLTIHQYLIVNIGKSEYKIDPFYGIFRRI